MKRGIIISLVVVAIGAGAGAYYVRRGGSDVTVNTAPVTRGDVVDTVGATGTLQAVTTVQIGSQVSGNISWLGADFNSIVHKGQVIARIDPSILQAQVEQARANLVRSRAAVVGSQADVERSRVALADARQKFARTKELAAKNLLPQSDLDAATIAVDSAQAQLQSAQAAVQSTQAQVEQAQAALNQNQLNLEHCVITAPIDGIVIQRSIDVGQTVAASLQSPTLFIIAADLTQMQVNANIDEADVGRIRPNQTVTFRVDAYPADEFTGTVSQIRLQPIVVQNVTTYGTIVAVPNKDLKLKPGMTATLKVQIARRTDVLRVPNAALRFRPSADMFAALGLAVPPEVVNPGGRGGGTGSMSAPSAGSGQTAGANAQTGTGAMQQGAPAASARGGGSTGATDATGSRRTSGGRAGVPAVEVQAGTAASQQGAPAASARGGGSTGATDGATDAAGGGRMRGGRAGAPAAAQPGGSGQAGSSDPADRRAQVMERFKSMSPDEQKQFIDRMKERGGDVSMFQQAQPIAKAPAPASRKPPISETTYGALQATETIDALFAPLPPVESSGRAWLYVDKQLKPVRLRLGITDGTYTDLLSGELQDGMELVTGILTSGSSPTVTTSGAGNPLMPGRGGPPRGR